MNSTTIIVISMSAMEVVYYDTNRVVSLKHSGSDIEDEYYAEVDDVGVFFYPKQMKWFIQGQYPTFRSGEILTEDDGYTLVVLP